MNPHRRCGAALAAAGILLAACTDDSTSNPATDAVDYVRLVDDDSEPDQVLGEPGAYALTARGVGAPPLAVLDVPAGYSNFGSFALWPLGSGDEGIGQEEDPLVAVQYWTVHGVFADPCTRGRDPASEIGTSVEALAAALRAQRLTAVSESVPVALDGHRGLYLELTVSADATFADCDDGYFMLWEGRPADAQHVAAGPGSVERMWILDADGERVVLIGIVAPGVADGRVEELTRVVESVRFVEPQ